MVELVVDDVVYTLNHGHFPQNLNEGTEDSSNDGESSNPIPSQEPLGADLLPDTYFSIQKQLSLDICQIFKLSEKQLSDLKRTAQNKTVSTVFKTLILK